MEAAWNPDPSHRHELRYHDGAQWTEHVSDAGVTGVDHWSPDPVPPVAGAPVAAAPAAGPAFRNFSGDQQHEARVRSMLHPGEELTAIVGSEQRFISVTTQRLLLHEHRGGWSVIRNDAIDSIEVSDSDTYGRFVKLHFGVSSRTVGAPDDEQALAIVAAMRRR